MREAERLSEIGRRFILSAALQKSRDFDLAEASQIIAFSSVFGIVGTVLAGWLSDRIFKGDRVKPAILSGIISTSSLILFLFVGGGFILNIFYVSLFSLSVGVLYCIVAGLMAVDIVPRKATGAALGIVGISSYVAAGIQGGNPCGNSGGSKWAISSSWEPNIPNP